MTASNKLCKLAINGYDQRNSSACCWIKDAHGQPSVRHNITAKEYLNSSSIWAVREALQRGEEHPACEKCWIDESQGKVSKRVATDLNKDVRRNFTFAPYYAEPGELIYLTIFIGNKCNLACRTCGVHSSTGWIKEHKFIQKHTLDQPGFSMNPSVKPFDSSDIDVPLNKLQYLEVLGGEPFYELEHVKFIERICEEADPKKVTLFYSTNGTKTLDKQIEKIFSRFKKIIISFSIDAVYKPFEYIRTLGKWEEVEQTISYWGSKSNVQIQNHATISVLNIMYISELYNYFRQKQNFVDGQLSYTYASYPPQYTFDILGEDIKQKYNNDILSSIQFGYQTDSIQNYYKNSKFDEQSYNYFLSQIEYTNKFRNLAIQDYLPKLCKVLNI